MVRGRDGRGADGRHLDAGRRHRPRRGAHPPVRLIVDLFMGTRLLAPSFASVLRRPLTFHLAQAGLSFQRYRELAGLLKDVASERRERATRPERAGAAASEGACRGDRGAKPLGERDGKLKTCPKFEFKPGSR